MKKLITILFAGLLTLGLSAQTIDQGVFLIGTGTGMNFSSTSISDVSGDWSVTSNGTTVSSGKFENIFNKASFSSYNFELTNFSNWESRFLSNINLGYFVSDGLLVGLGLNISGTGGKIEQKNDPNIGANGSTEEVMERNVTLTPKIRYYMEAGAGALFFEGSFSMSSYKGRDYDKNLNGDYTEEIYKNSETTIGLGAGYAIFLGDAFAIEPMLSLGMWTKKGGNPDPNSPLPSILWGPTETTDNDIATGGSNYITTDECKITGTTFAFTINMSLYLE